MGQFEGFTDAVAESDRVVILKVGSYEQPTKKEKVVLFKLEAEYINLDLPDGRRR